MFEMDLSDNIAAKRAELTRFERQQLPYATASALNDTAFAVRTRFIGATWQRAFPDARNARFPRVAFRVFKATKLTLAASVRDVLHRGNLGLHASGGTKTPRGRAITVPVPGRVRRTGRGVVPSQRPRVLLDRDDTFIARIRRNEAAIWQRTKGGGLKLLYVLEAGVPIQRTFTYGDDGRREARAVFPAAFDKALAWAIATAR